MATAKRISEPKYQLELTEYEAQVLYTLIGNYIVGPDTPDSPRGATSSVWAALEDAGVRGCEMRVTAYATTLRLERNDA